MSQQNPNSTSQEDNTFKLIFANQLEPMLANNSPVIVDTRDQASFDQSHIKGAIRLSNESLADFLRETDPDDSVVVCCYHGISSQQVAAYLISQDFTDVSSLEGGFTHWQTQYPDQIESS